jgi:hypothetical protein
MVERVIRFTLFFGALVPAFLIPWFIGGHMLEGLSKSEAVVMSLGYLTPVSWFFLLGLYILEVRRNMQLFKG